MFATLLDKLHLVTCASRLCGGNGIGLSGEESTTWKPSRLQGVGPMGMLADDPKEGKGRPADADASASPQLVRSGLIK